MVTLDRLFLIYTLSRTNRFDDVAVSWLGRWKGGQVPVVIRSDSYLIMLFVHGFIRNEKKAFSKRFSNGAKSSKARRTLVVTLKDLATRHSKKICSKRLGEKSYKRRINSEKILIIKMFTGSKY